MNKLTGVMLFFAGAAVGALAAYRAAKTKFERIADEEIASVKAVFTSRRTEAAGNEPDIPEPFKTEVGKAVGNSGKSLPYVIPPQEFGEKDGYGSAILTYYADRVLANEEDEPMNANEFGDLEDVFSESEDDSVYFRDDVAKVDYEILRDDREYKRRK